MQNEITEGMTLEEILKYPDACKILTKHKLPCLHCPMAAFEMGKLKIGEVAKMYGIDIKGLIKDLNKNIKGKNE